LLLKLYHTDWKSKNKNFYKIKIVIHFSQGLIHFAEKRNNMKKSNCSRLSRGILRSPSARKSFQREKRAFSHYCCYYYYYYYYYYAEREGGKEIARNACEKVQSRILYLAFQVSKQHSIEKLVSCAIAFSRERAKLVNYYRLDKCNMKYRASHLAFIQNSNR